MSDLFEKLDGDLHKRCQAETMVLHRRRTSSERREGSGRRAAAVSRAGSESHWMETRNLSVPVFVGSVGFMKRCSFSFVLLKDWFQTAGETWSKIASSFPTLKEAGNRANVQSDTFINKYTYFWLSPCVSAATHFISPHLCCRIFFFCLISLIFSCVFFFFHLISCLFWVISAHLISSLFSWLLFLCHLISFNLI